MVRAAERRYREDRSVPQQITDDDPSGTVGLSVGDTSVWEGDGNTVSLTFAIRLSSSLAGPVTFHYATTDDSAVSPGDYVSKSGNLTIPAGNVSAKVLIPIRSDTFVEPGETFTLTLSAVTGAALLDGVGVGAIFNDDGSPGTNGALRGRHP